MIGELLSDLRAIMRVCSPLGALRWAAGIVATLPAVLKTRSLLPDDRSMGNGPFKVRHHVGDAVLVGDQAFSGLRDWHGTECIARAARGPATLAA